MTEALRIGILGGSFDPPHLAHLLIAQEAWYRFELGHVYMVPAAQNPLKEPRGDEASGDQRLDMLRLACEPDTRLRLDALELRRSGVSYTIETLERMRQRHPQSELYLLMGADAAARLGEWRDVRRFGEFCTVAVFSRPGETELTDSLADTMRVLSLRFEFMPVPMLDISGTDIRRRVRQGKPIRYFVPDEVAEYIHTHGIYRAAP